MDCAFCTQDEIKYRTIVGNDLAIAFLTYTPVTPGHTLVVPRRHVQTHDELTLEEQHALEELRRLIRASLKKVYAAEGFNYAWNEGEVAGQTVPHVHLHIVPRKAGDAGVHGYEAREYLYRPSEREQWSQEKLLEATEKIKATLDS